MGRPAYPTVKWSAAGTASPMVKCDGNQLVGFVTGPTLVSTAITFNMLTTVNTVTNPTPVPVKSSTAPISFTVTTNSYYGFSADQQSQFLGVEVFQFVGGSAEAVGTTIQPVFIPRQY